MSHTVFVTGSDGFLGSALCPFLEAQGYHVRRGVQFPQDGPPSPDVFVADIGPDTSWDTQISNVDTIIHLAARVHVMNESASDPLAAFRYVNTDGTKQLAASAATHGVKRFIFISTIGVHGGSTSKRSPFSEQSAIEPHTAYAQSKWEAEQILRQIEAQTGLEVVIIRPPLVYGPHVPGNFLRLLKLVRRGFPLPLGNTNNLRSLVSRTNLVSFLHQCIEHPKAAGETFLCSDGEDMSTTGLVQKIALNLEFPLRVFPFPEAIIRLAGRILNKEHLIEQLWGSLVVDSSKARELLDWTPPTSMDEELTLLAKWFKSQADNQMA